MVDALPLGTRLPQPMDSRQEYGQMFADYFVWTVVRNPWARAVSSYRMLSRYIRSECKVGLHQLGGGSLHGRQLAKMDGESHMRLVWQLPGQQKTIRPNSCIWQNSLVTPFVAAGPGGRLGRRVP